MKKIIKIVALGVLIFGLFSLSLKTISSKFIIGANVTPSLDKDYFIFKREWRGQIAKGEIIYFRLPVETPYYKKDSRFAKIIRCEGGEVLTIKESDYFCNGEFIGSAKATDQEGRAAEAFWYEGEIAKGDFFVMGTHERSYDSRYWGFVNEKEIEGVAIWSF